jgi:Ca2+-binding RTX toxin-like protein
LIFRLGPNGTPDRTFAGGGAVVVPVQGASVAVGGGGARPTILDPGPRGIRNYLPPEPELLRLRGGTSRVRCGGKRATIVGTARGETLRGTSRADVIAGLGGRDEIHGGRGGDLICGGAGSDRLDGGPGRDRLHQ